LPLTGARAEPPVRSIGTDPAAFTDFYRAHVDEVTRFVVRRVADPQLAADLTAEVFLAVIAAAAQYRGSFGGPRAWLYGIARNVIAAEFRRSARERRAENLIAGRRLLDATSGRARVAQPGTDRWPDHRLPASATAQSAVSADQCA
jgi:RNA polymerase sigma-70 factor (ECF subfamily)